MPRKSAGIARSLDVYYRDAQRTARMDRLNAQFVGPGDLAFDIGAHVGDRTASFLRMGASVVALEPQPRVFRALRLIHGRTAKAILLPKAAGAHSGHITMHINSENPTISTASQDLIRTAKSSADWRDEVWDNEISVPITTLERLIAQHGVPHFIKIDVEGHEAAVLAGLRTAVSAFSFEFTTIQREVAFACLDRVAELGHYEFNMSLGEDHALRHENWISEHAVRAEIASLPGDANSGDIYARKLR